MRGLQALAAVLISTGMLVACGEAAGPARSSSPAQPAAQIESPQLLVWNSAANSPTRELYAYRIDSSGSLNLLPGFPLRQDIASAAIVAPEAGLLFIANGSASLDSYLLTPSGPQLKASWLPQTVTLSDGSTVSTPPAPVAVWPAAHELIGFYGVQAFGFGDLQRFSYDASGNLISVGQLQPAQASYLVSTVRALPASNMLVVLGGITGHTCGDTYRLDAWAVAADGSLNFLSPGTILGSDCNSPAYPSDIAVSGAGAVVAAYGGTSDMTGSPFGEFHTFLIGGDGTATAVSVVPVPSLAGYSFRLAIDEADRLVFVAAAVPGNSAETLLWYAFDPVTGVMSPGPLGSMSGVNINSMAMIGKYLVANAPSGVLITYASTANGPQQVSQQQLPLPSTTMWPVQ